MLNKRPHVSLEIYTSSQTNTSGISPAHICILALQEKGKLEANCLNENMGQCLTKNTVYNKKYVKNNQIYLN